MGTLIVVGVIFTYSTECNPNCCFFRLNLGVRGLGIARNRLK
jgi:hypothetical protein